MQKFKFRNKISEIQLLKSKCWNPNVEIQMQKFNYWNPNIEIQIQKYKCRNTKAEFSRSTNKTKLHYKNLYLCSLHSLCKCLKKNFFRSNYFPSRCFYLGRSIFFRFEGGFEFKLDFDFDYFVYMFWGEGVVSRFSFRRCGFTLISGPYRALDASYVSL